MAKRPTGQARSRDNTAVSALTQFERFMQAARDLECDDDPERFKERVKKIGRSTLQVKEADKT